MRRETPLLVCFWGAVMGGETPSRASIDDVLAWWTDHPDANAKEVSRHFSGWSSDSLRALRSKLNRRAAKAVSVSPAKPVSVVSVPASPPDPEPVPAVVELPLPEDLPPREMMRWLRVALGMRLRVLASPESIRGKGSQSLALQIGILTDKLKVFQEMYGLGDGGEDDSRADPGGVLAALDAAKG